MKKIRIMIYNTGYFRGLTGKTSEYFFRFNRIVFKNTEFKDRLSKSIASLVAESDPDILFIEETRNEPFMRYIKTLFLESHIDVKYEPKSFLRLTPFFSGNCNGVFFKHPYKMRRRYLKNGTKKLVYQVDVNESFSLFFSHFALGKATRKKQFNEIAEMINEKKQVAVAGDFNIFGGDSELKELLKKGGLEIKNNFSESTFPSFQPKHSIDLFLSSPSIKIISVKVLKGILFSDHLPVIIDIELE
ncbi:MAG: endonuclease/exonuclease/phosphatase family protein [Candidatus Parcubacteria bacterium]|nr:endonuclease/exonuclease/phosphatase family protein [Candidatus Parcubacteria bacterium]